MKIALIGGTHGNEPVGIEVMNLFQESSKDYKNEFECFWGNPKAFELKKRYVDTDLNRAFGKNGIRKGYEKERAVELESQIKGHFDFSIDLHTTTTNMGLTAILNNTHPSTQKAAQYLKQELPEIKLIEEDKLDEDCTHLNRLCPGGLTIEVGPVANNVINAELVLKTHWIVEKLLDFDFSYEFGTSKVEVYKMLGVENYPENNGWYVHPELEGNDFKELQKGHPLFINIEGEEILLEKEGPLYPFFINEAAYLENKSAYLLAEKRTTFTKNSQTD